ncbi:MAG: type II toxin-antitoxin system VapC family toxin [Acidobacteriota bacterium]|nr:type II toxin-antitoxin system VapC family toxin [Acidobacteriota bacterium]
MKLLLDTHIFLWFITADKRLSLSARQLIEEGANDKFVSVASLWEIAVKHSLKKLTLIDEFDTLFPAQINNNGFGLLEIKTEHLSGLINLPFHHWDPFDRLLAAQTIYEKFEIISVDAIFDSYNLIRHS